MMLLTLSELEALAPMRINLLWTLKHCSRRPAPSMQARLIIAITVTNPNSRSWSTQPLVHRLWWFQFVTGIQCRTQI